MTQKPECPYCGATEGLRIKTEGYGPVAPEYTCESCFTGTDTGPSFDDLQPRIIRRCVFPYCSCEMHCDSDGRSAR